LLHGSKLPGAMGRRMDGRKDSGNPDRLSCNRNDGGGGNYTNNRNNCHVDCGTGR